jgi:5,10-methylene-tetrahydrofolate dehydrogenase/methenyl tetrahydrofolate cyclohydrolase
MREAIINAIDPAKDVDGFHVINAGRLAVGQDPASCPARRYGLPADAERRPSASLSPVSMR